MEVLDDKGKSVINSHLSKTGKTSVSEFTEEELDELRNELTDNNTQAK